ncbi:MAG: Asp-tRNA(Asn)/Glu-tRNA(Gln) amidotransferase subunit GatC [Candidatus Lokiarchaeota archaeon]
MKEKELSKETIDYISKLALIDVSEKEKEKLLNQLNEIINYFKKLKDLDTKNIEPLYHPIKDLYNVFREDKVQKGLTQEEALKNAENTKDGYIKAPRIVKE